MHRRSLVIGGEDWVAFEVRPLGDVAAEELALASGWLCFEKDFERRRFFLIPEGWERWPESQLVTLWHTAKRCRPDAWQRPPLPRRAREGASNALTTSESETQTRVDLTSAR